MKRERATTGPAFAHPSGKPLANGRAGNEAGAPLNATVFQQFEAIVDSDAYTAEQKCILVKLRCRVDGKTFAGAIVDKPGLMRAASLKDPRKLRAEMRDLQGKVREMPAMWDKKGRPLADPRDENGDPIEDAIDPSRATIVEQERKGQASVFDIRPDRLQAIIAQYEQVKAARRRPGRPPRPLPAAGAPSAPAAAASAPRPEYEKFCPGSPEHEAERARLQAIIETGTLAERLNAETALDRIKDFFVRPPTQNRR